jgi:hypothetical protein
MGYSFKTGELPVILPLFERQGTVKRGRAVFEKNYA